MSMFGAEVIRTLQQGKPRIDLKIGGANVFIAEVLPDAKVNPPPQTPYQGLDHFGLSVQEIDAVVAELKAKLLGSAFRCGRGHARGQKRRNGSSVGAALEQLD